LKVAILISHPIQHEVPFFQALSQDKSIDLDVIYYSSEGVNSFNVFGLKGITYGIPMLEGYNAILLKNISPFSNYKLRYISPGIIKVLKRCRYDHVLLYGYNSPTSLLALWYCRQNRIPISLRCEGESVQRTGKLKAWIRKQTLTHTFKQFDGFTAICMANKEHYLKYRVPENKISLVTQTVNDFFFSFPDSSNNPAIKKKYGLKDEIIFVYGSKLRREKDPLDAIKAFCLLPEDIKAKLIVLSDGPEKLVCEQWKANNDAVDRIIFTGYVDFQEMRDLFNLADVLVMTSSETIGATLYQALFSKLAIISSDMVPGWYDVLIPGENGLTYRKGDVKMLSHIISYLARNPKKIKEMKKRSFQHSRNFSASTAAIQFKEHLKKVQQQCQISYAY